MQVAVLSLTMIYPPDELLEDLQTVLPEVQAKQQAASASPYDSLPELPGTNNGEYHRYDEPPASPGGSNSSGSQVNLTPFPCCVSEVASLANILAAIGRSGLQ